MRTLLILLLLCAPTSAAKWDLDNLTPSQRNALVVIRDSWNNGFRGTPRCPPCSGVKHVWYDGRVKDATQSGHFRTPGRPGRPLYKGPGPNPDTIRTLPDTGPQMILNPFVSKAEGGGGK